ncbi:MAG: hypothetical protein M3507_00625 [Actinomycetota bacterium]|jgi:hypothetical protein|nr:hypothetical protein [Actinomycetota bacterium]
MARSVDEVRAGIGALPWQQREAIFEATSAGRPVGDESLAELAAEWAGAQHAPLAKLFLVLLLPLCAASGVGVIVAAERDDGIDARGLLSP